MKQGDIVYIINDYQLKVYPMVYVNTMQEKGSKVIQVINPADIELLEDSCSQRLL